MARSESRMLRSVTTSAAPSTGATPLRAFPAQVTLSLLPTSCATRSGLAAGRLAPPTRTDDQARVGRGRCTCIANSLPRTQARARSSVVTVDFIKGVRLSHLIVPEWPVSVGAATLPAAHAPADETIVMPRKALQIYLRKEDQMSRNFDPMETAMLDLGVFRHEMIKHFSSDQQIDPDEHRLIKLFDAPYREASRINKCWVAFTALMRNGLTRHTGTLAKDADLRIVVDNTGKVSNVIPFPGTEDRSYAG